MEYQCCCFSVANFNQRRRQRLADNEPMANERRRRSKQRSHNKSASRASESEAPEQTLRCEEIELTCYSLSPNCLLVDADKRYRCLLGTNNENELLRARPLDDFHDGRKLLDSRRRPESMSLIKFKMNPASGQLERRLSIHELDQNSNEFLVSLPGTQSNNNNNSVDQVENQDNNKDTKIETRHEVAERLATRSFLLIERTSQQLDQANAIGGHKNSAYALAEVEAPEVQLDKSWEVLEDASKQATVNNNSSNTELIESISIVAPLNEENVNVKKKRKKSRMNFARRALARILGHQQEITTSTAHHLQRPESIYLWPPTSDSLLPVINQQQQQQQFRMRQQVNQHRAMISYNHAEGKEFALQLHDELERLGVSTYLDLYDIGTGHDWQDSLNFAILNCRLFVALVTPSYGQTLWTSRECKLADVLAKRIIPINFGLPRWPPPSLAIQFATLQYIDWLQDLTPGEFPVVSSCCYWPSECVQSVARQLAAINDYDSGQSSSCERQLQSADSGYSGDDSQQQQQQQQQQQPTGRKKLTMPSYGAIDDCVSSSSPSSSPQIDSSSSSDGSNSPDGQFKLTLTNACPSIKSTAPAAAAATETINTKTQRKKIIRLGHGAKRALSRVKRSLGATQAIHIE